MEKDKRYSIILLSISKYLDRRLDSFSNFDCSAFIDLVSDCDGGEFSNYKYEI